MADVAADVPHRVVDVPVGDDEIDRAVEVHVREDAAEPQRVSRRGADARAHRFVLVQAASQRPIEADHLVVEIRDREARSPGTIDVRCVDAHSGARLAVGAEGHTGLDRDVLERAVPLVAIELVRLRVVRHEEIGPAVLIVIQHRHAERLRAGVEDAARRRDVLERAVAAVAEQPARVAAVGLGRAVRLLLAVEAAEDVVFGGPLDVVADEEIEQPVAIEVEPQGGCAEARPPVQPARARGVHEGALARVAEQAILSDARDQDVREPVVVRVAHGHAHSVELDVETRGPRDIGERAVPCCSCTSAAWIAAWRARASPCR